MKNLLFTYILSLQDMCRSAEQSPKKRNKEEEGEELHEIVQILRKSSWRKFEFCFVIHKYMCVILRRDARGVYIHICVYVCVNLTQKLEVYIHICTWVYPETGAQGLYILLYIYTYLCVSLWVYVWGSTLLMSTAEIIKIFSERLRSFGNNLSLNFKISNLKWKLKWKTNQLKNNSICFQLRIWIRRWVTKAI